MGTRLVIDHREGKLKELSATGIPGFPGIGIQYENLELGDIVIYHGDSMVYMMERKKIGRAHV